MSLIQIFGVARSGTTALYALVCRILEARYGRDGLARVYEPFLWDAGSVADYPLYQDTEAFRWMSSLSIEGMYFHRMLPLFCRNSASVDPDLSLDALRRHLRTGAEARPVLIKYIRANGRIGMLRELFPGCRNLLIVRNPLSTINSVVNRFSFFGDDFHTSDWPRFAAEVPAAAAALPDTDLHRSLQWWRYMTTRACEAALGRDDTMVLCHEDFVAHQEAYTRRICDFLGQPFDGSLAGFAGEQVGRAEERRNLDRAEVQAIRPYLDLYAQLLERMFGKAAFDPAEVERRFLDRPLGERRIFPLRGRNTTSIRGGVRPVDEGSGR